VPDPAGGLIDYTKEYAKHQLLMASWLTDQVTVPIAVNLMHAEALDRDIIGLNIYQQSVAAGASQDEPSPTTRQLWDRIAAGRATGPQGAGARVRAVATRVVAPD
jgi:hypothetical protein